MSVDLPSKRGYARTSCPCQRLDGSSTLLPLQADIHNHPVKGLVYLMAEAPKEQSFLPMKKVRRIQQASLCTHDCPGHPVPSPPAIGRKRWTLTSWSQSGIHQNTIDCLGTFEQAWVLAFLGIQFYENLSNW